MSVISSSSLSSDNSSPTLMALTFTRIALARFFPFVQFMSMNGHKLASSRSQEGKLSPLKTPCHFSDGYSLSHTHLIDMQQDTIRCYLSVPLPQRSQEPSLYPPRYSLYSLFWSSFYTSFFSVRRYMVRMISFRVRYAVCMLVYDCYLCYL